ncbi:hypothetical protein [Kordiimonas gwangyangensis]|uniref:hypothetical protein n=1 Tax=Kordiimonas gwangyangensis TaxID=288022 RepID=UPI000470E15D|nr:hypothetical protein [Kordiimonas gwangyangensis]
MTMRTITCGAAFAFVTATTLYAPEAAEAKSFKAKYYKECYQGVKDVAPLVTPKESMKEKASKLGGLFSSVGSLAGLGGSGGTAMKALNTANKIEKYSSIAENVAGYSAQMRTEHPDPNDRFAAYGDQMSSEARDLESVTIAVNASQQCYSEAFAGLKAQVDSGELKASKAKKQVKEIQSGVRASGDVLILAIDRLNKNLSSYDEAWRVSSSIWRQAPCRPHRSRRATRYFSKPRSRPGLQKLLPVPPTSVRSRVSRILQARMRLWVHRLK